MLEDDDDTASEAGELDDDTSCAGYNLDEGASSINRILTTKRLGLKTLDFEGSLSLEGRVAAEP